MIDIIVDVDNVLIDTIKAFTSIYNDIINRGSKVDYRDVLTYGFNELKLKEEQKIKLFSSKILWTYMEIKPGAIETLCSLREKGVNVVISTRGSKENIKNKLDFLQKYFIDFSIIPIVTVDKPTSKMDKDCIRSRIIIDDSLAVLEHVSENTIPVCFRDRPYKWSDGWEGIIIDKWDNAEKIILDLLKGD